MIVCFSEPRRGGEALPYMMFLPPGMEFDYEFSCYITRSS